MSFHEEFSYRRCNTQAISLYFHPLIIWNQVYVDALGTTTTYEAYLSNTFPGIQFTVTNKADSKFKIVGAASIAAKVTRDVCLENWHFEENDASSSSPSWNTNFGSGYPSGSVCL
jgi:ribonuclease H2 subunit A